MAIGARCCYDVGSDDAAFHARSMVSKAVSNDEKPANEYCAKCHSNQYLVG